MDEQYIIDNIYPLVKRHQQQQSRQFWVDLSKDPNNPHIHKLAKQRIEYIDTHPDEYPYPWMSKEPREDGEV